MSLPPIPDNSYKFLLYAGIIMLGYGILKSIDARKEYNILVNNSNSYIDSLTIREMHQKTEKNKLLATAAELSLRHNIKNPIIDNDSVTYFNMTLTGPNVQVLITDSLRNLWNSLKNQNFEIELLNQKIKMTKAHLKGSEKELKEIDLFYMVISFLGLLFVSIGYSGLDKVQNLQEKLLNLEISSKETKYKHCQSCGRRFSSMRLIGHDEKGEINPAFCIECFDKGKFKEPDLTADEFKARAENIILSAKSKKKRNQLRAHFDSLERWKQDGYI